MIFKLLLQFHSNKIFNSSAEIGFDMKSGIAAMIAGSGISVVPENLLRAVDNLKSIISNSSPPKFQALMNLSPDSWLKTGWL
ncbi:unnamed protein product [Blepharisma stoltei]|uniref:LysR substrate-binding domain-containing protein n=1 Tax=Blepharisma stoltei TaxID=1481888 RepID=A0AAU9JV89_9CILI|nr:unnamed protein product [Blepharisma stoltei]